MASQSENATAAADKVVADDDASQEPKTFKELGIVDNLCDACTSLGWTAPTPIQIVSPLHPRNEASASADPRVKGGNTTGTAEQGHYRFVRNRKWKDRRLCSTHIAKSSGQSSPLLCLGSLAHP